LFGADLPDAWQNANQTLTLLNGLRRQHRAVKAITRLGAILAAPSKATAFARKLFPGTCDWYDIHMM
jgi:hypothetical protein